jgi:hypothetical protein
MRCGDRAAWTGAAVGTGGAGTEPRGQELPLGQEVRGQSRVDRSCRWDMRCGDRAAWTGAAAGTGGAGTEPRGQKLPLGQEVWGQELQQQASKALACCCAWHASFCAATSVNSCSTLGLDCALCARHCRMSCRYSGSQATVPCRLLNSDMSTSPLHTRVRVQ